MRVIRSYEVTINQKILDDLEQLGYDSGALIDACTRYYDAGDQPTLYLVVLPDETQQWVEFNHLIFPVQLLYVADAWDCYEVGWTVGDKPVD